MHALDTHVLLRLSIQRRVVTTALKIGLIVGTILNLINQGHVLTAPDFFEKLAFGKLVLTYCVPYLVSTYSSVATLYQLKKNPTDFPKSTRANNPVVSS